MSCFLCCGSSDEEEEEMKIKEEKVRSSGSTSKQPLGAPSVLRASRVSSASEDKSEEQKISQSAEAAESKDGKSSRIPTRTFSYQELAGVTQNFAKECLIGEGGFGGVYKGQLQDTRQVVAVKKLDKHGPQGNREFLVEVLMLSLLHHPNLVKLIGYCSEEDQRLLVYEFMPLGSLEDHLHDIHPRKEPLDWNTRMKIAAGAAVGLEYLHNKATPPVIYRDLKSSNILLGEGYFPKLSDFGLAKLGPVGDRTHVSTRVMGTYGYCAPEYAMTGKLTVKSDIYSFGVVLLEIITGRKAIDYTRPSGEQNLVAWARPLFRDRKNFSKMADPMLQQCYPKRGLYQALAIAAMCVQEQATARPIIEDVVAALKYLTAQVYDPNEVSPQSSRLSPTQRTREYKNSRSIVSNNQHATQSSNHCSPGLQGDLVSESDSARGGDGTGMKQDFIGLQIDEFQNDSPMKKTRQSPRNANRDCDRERAVAEAKLWGENWREKLR